MKTVIEKVGEQVSIQIEAEDGDSPEDVAFALVEMDKIINDKKEGEEE